MEVGLLNRMTGGQRRLQSAQKNGKVESVVGSPNPSGKRGKPRPYDCGHDISVTSKFASAFSPRGVTCALCLNQDSQDSRIYRIKDGRNI